MSFEIHQSFMVGYVRRINEATFNVTIGGVRIGEARYTRLAQINLRSRIITFSRFAIENVPERARRYLVIHELAHVLESGHTQRFWNLVARHEPNYKEVGRELDRAFHQNVRAALKPQSNALLAKAASEPIDELRLIDDVYNGADDDDGIWMPGSEGIICGGV